MEFYKALVGEKTRKILFSDLIVTGYWMGWRKNYWKWKTCNWRMDVRNNGDGIQDIFVCPVEIEERISNPQPDAGMEQQ